MMNTEHKPKKPGPFVLILMSPYLALFISWMFVQQGMVAPKYGQAVANVFGWHAITMVVIASVLNSVKNFALRRFGFRD